MKNDVSGSNYLLGITIILTLILISSAGFALNYAAEFTTDINSVKLCPTGSSQVTGIIKNTGTSEDTYTITSSSPWITVAPDKVTIKGNSEESVYLYVTPAIDAAPNNYKLIISVKPKSDTSVVYTQDLTATVINCHGVSITPEITEYSGCIGENLKLDFNVTNTGKAIEKYIVCTSTGICSEYTDINSAETKKVSLTVPVQSNIETIDVIASSKSSYASDSAKVSLSAKAICYSAAVLTIPDVQSSCRGEDATYDIIVKNIGGKADNFVLYANGINATIKNDKITLLPNEMAKTTISIPTKNLDSGIHEFSVAIESTNSKDVSRSKLNVENCYTADVSVEPVSAEVCPGKPSSYIINIKNTGKRSDIYIIESTSGELSNKVASLKDSESLKSILVVNSNTNEGGEKNITVHVSSANTGRIEKTIVQKLKTMDTCYGFDIKPTLQVSTISEYKGVLYVIKVKNSGLYPINVQGNVRGPEWVNIDPTSLDVGMNEEKSIYVYMSPAYGTPDGVYTANITVSNDYGMKKETQVSLVLNAKAPTPTGAVISPGIAEEVGNASETEISEDKYEGIATAFLVGIIIILLIIIGPYLLSGRDTEKKRKLEEDELKKALIEKKADVIVEKTTIKTKIEKKEKPKKLLSKKKKEPKEAKIEETKKESKETEKTVISAKSSRNEDIKAILDNI